ncbi:hypothetical protein [Salinimonas iocasae]|uniref:hypothetical protein n=1 Tax=Salinimonas iocasae TaxID=2572577 RepID=UPI00143D1149|nr:hypothetical protein [Salinimonas iocasae]
MKDWAPKPIEKGYGPSKNVDELFNFFDPQFTFTRELDAQKALHSELDFLKALRSEIDY